MQIAYEDPTTVIAQSFIVIPNTVNDRSWYMDYEAIDHVASNANQLNNKVHYAKK